MLTETKDKIFEINYFGPLRLIKGLTPILKQRKIAQIVNVSSTAGERPFPNSGIYASTKAALNSLSETLAMEFDLDSSLKHIKIVNTWPGVTKTKIFSRDLLADPQKQRSLTYPKGSVSPQKIAGHIIKHLSTPKSRRRIILARDRLVLFGNGHFRWFSDWIAKKYD